MVASDAHHGQSSTVAIVMIHCCCCLVLSADNVMELFSLAHQFSMDELLGACVTVLNECMNCDDVCRVLEAAVYYGHLELSEKCWDLIAESTPR